MHIIIYGLYISHICISHIGETGVRQGHGLNETCPHIGSCICTSEPQRVVLFGKVMEPICRKKDFIGVSPWVYTVWPGCLFFLSF